MDVVNFLLLILGYLVMLLSVSEAMTLQPPYSKRTNALKWKTSLIYDKAYGDTYKAA